MTYKIVYNSCYGGFSLSPEAVKLARDLSGDKNWGGVRLVGEKYDHTGEICDFFYGHIYNIPRHNKILVDVVKKLGNHANGYCAELQIHETDNPYYRIDEYDGNETVMSIDDYEMQDASKL